MNHIHGLEPRPTKTISRKFRHERIHGHCTLLRVPESQLQKNTIRSYHFSLPKFEARFADRKLDSLTTDEMWGFLTQQTDGTSQGTKKLRYSLLFSFFNFGKNILDPDLPNPCDTPVLMKIFAHPKPKQWTVLDKDVVDEMIFRTENLRNRLILELMARSGLCIRRGSPLDRG